MEQPSFFMQVGKNACRIQAALTACEPTLRWLKNIGSWPIAGVDNKRNKIIRLLAFEYS
jgi:hypothetical protein